MRIGDLEIHLLSDGSVRSDAGGPFGLVPRVLYQRYVQPADDNTIAVALHSLLIRSRGTNILVDTGFGSKMSEKDRARWRMWRQNGDLLSELERLGLSPDKIDLVINTHLHSDHCGGNTRQENGRLVASFPKAEYWVQRLEWADASHPDLRTRGTYFSENFSPLLAEGRMRLLHGDTPVNDQVRCVVTPGHTPGHQSVVISSGEWRGFFVADMASRSVNMKHVSWLSSYDVNPIENLATKQRWQEWALEKQAWLFFEHDPIVPVGRLVPSEDGIELEPIEEAAELIDFLPTPPPLHELSGESRGR